MTDAEGNVQADETPEADALEQQRAVDFEDDSGLDPDLVAGEISDRDASDADLIDQAIVVPVTDDDWELDS